jgi:hypothetical protein
MSNRSLLRLAGISAVLALAAACGSTASTGAPTDTPADTVAAATTTPATLPTDTPAPTPATATDTPTPSATAAATPSTGPAATPAARVAWVHGQTVMANVLVAPGVGWVYTNRGVWQTIDDGTTWANATPAHLIVSKIRGLGALDADHALLAVVDVGHSTSTYYMWHTSNAGLTWAYTALPPITHDVTTGCTPGDFCGQPGDPPAEFDYVDANTAFVHIGMRTGFDGLANYIFETTNGGATWAARPFNPPDPSLGSGGVYRVQFKTPSMGVAQLENEISSTTTGWGHWTNRSLPSTDFWTPTIDFLTADKWVADEGIDYRTVHYHFAVSTDHGSSWVDHTVDVPGVSGLEAAQVHFLSSLVWIGTIQTGDTFGTTGPSQTIYTVDGGAHWALEGPQPFNGSIANFVDATHGWTDRGSRTTAANLYSTADGGRTWRLLTP